MNAQVQTDWDARNLNHVRQIAHDIENGLEMEEHHDGYDPECPAQIMTGFDWLADALDIQYIINSDRTFRSARVLVAFGGPNIWVDFSRGMVELWWGGDYAKAHFYSDPMGIEEALEELWGCL
jgi:hypothetical protein